MFPDRCTIHDVFSDSLQIISERQLLDESLWANCVNVFSSAIDDADRGWRGEYWGKMMRGACLVWRVTRSPALYDMLTCAVEGLLKKQEPNGRFSTYSVENEFYGWDIWARKYVMTGLQHYRDICTDDALRTRVLTALCAHADYILSHIGEDKIPILATGLYWGSVNSASILEPFLRLYKDTKTQKYLDFAEYILSTGGCSDGDLLECVFAGKAPYGFPEQKAYETMSFFEGVLAYYEITGKPRYLDAVQRFTDALLETDYTAIGSCGCTHELFDHSTLRQTEQTDSIMQETCVTVTLMRLLARLYAVTGEKKLIDALCKSARNALAGALNRNGYAQYSNEKKAYLPGMVIDSYSPLCGGRRGRGIGGFKQFADGTHFGCCACIASAGFALYPLMCVTSHGTEIRVNDLLRGEYVFRKESGDVRITVSADAVRVQAPADVRFTLCVTSGDDGTAVRCGQAAVQADGFMRFSDVRDGDVFPLTVSRTLRETTINGKHSFCFGGYTLAADTKKGGVYAPDRPLTLLRDENGRVQYAPLPPQDGERVRIAVRTDCGLLMLTDYAAAGQDGQSAVSVWF